MSKTHPPELKRYMDKQMDLKLNGNRKVSGILRGFDPFMNIVVEEAVEHLKVSFISCWPMKPCSSYYSQGFSF